MKIKDKEKKTRKSEGRVNQSAPGNENLRKKLGLSSGALIEKLSGSATYCGWW